MNESDFFADFRTGRFGRWRRLDFRLNDRRFFFDFRFWFRRRRGDENYFFLDPRGFWGFGNLRRGDFFCELGIFLEKLLFEELRGDFIKRT